MDGPARGKSRASATPSTELLPYALGILDEEHRPALVERLPWDTEGVEAVERGTHVDEWAALWDEMTMVRRSVPGAAW